MSLLSRPTGSRVLQNCPGNRQPGSTPHQPLAASHLSGAFPRGCAQKLGQCALHPTPGFAAGRRLYPAGWAGVGCAWESHLILLLYHKAEFLPAYPALLILLAGYLVANTFYWNRAAVACHWSPRLPHQGKFCPGNPEDHRRHLPGVPALDIWQAPPCWQARTSWGSAFR